VIGLCILTSLLISVFFRLHAIILYLDGYVHSEPAVRESAGLAFSTLYKVVLFFKFMLVGSEIKPKCFTPNPCKIAMQSAGMQAIDEIVPTLLHALEDDKTSDTALDGLKQILR